MSLTKEQLKKGEWYILTHKGEEKSTFLYKFDRFSDDCIYRTIGAYMTDTGWMKFSTGIGWVITSSLYTITKADMSLVKRIFPCLS